MKFLKKRSVQISLGVLILLILGVGGFLLIGGSSNSKTTQQLPVDDNVIQTMSPSAIGLKLEASPDKKKVRFSISNASNISSIEYELLYTANSTAEELS